MTVVAGIGLNVNQTRDELPLDAPTEPGSLRTLTGQTYDRARAARLAPLPTRAHLRRLAPRRARPTCTARSAPRDFLRGRRITVDGEAATALQILRDGRLEVATGNGHGADASDRVGRGAASSASCRGPRRADEKVDHEADRDDDAPEPPPERLRCRRTPRASPRTPAAGRPRRTGRRLVDVEDLRLDLLDVDRLRGVGIVVDSQLACLPRSCSPRGRTGSASGRTSGRRSRPAR